MKKKILTSFLILLSVSMLRAQDQPTPASTPTATNKVDDNYTWTMYLRQNTYFVDSATQANAMKVNNTFYLNRILGGRAALSKDSPGQFTGMGTDYGFGVRHGKLFKSNWLFSFANLKDTSSTVVDFDSTAFSSSTFAFGASAVSQYNYTSNTLKTARISYLAEFFPWNSANALLAKLGFRFGPELYANGLKMFSSNNVYAQSGFVSTRSSTSSSFTTVPFSGGGVDFIEQNKKTYDEYFANAVIGVSYAVDFRKSRFDFSADYFRSLASSGSYLSKYNVLIPLSSNASFPSSVIESGTFTTNLTGFRFQSGFKYQFFEHFGIRLSAGFTTATHSVAGSKFKDGSGTSLGSLLSGGLNVNTILLATQPGFGPNPSSTDRRTQLGIEFFFRF